MTPEADSRFGSTPRREEARATITKTTITPAPGSEPPAGDEPPKRSFIDRLRGGTHGELTAAEPPLQAVSKVRLVLATLLSALSLLTVGGAILVLLLWQQDRESGVLTSQLDRTWDLFDALRELERWVAFAAVAVAVTWIAIAAVNIGRATGVRRNPVVAALSLPVGVIGAWIIGDQIVAEADDWVGQLSGVVLQCVFLAIPLLALLRLAQPAEARHRPLRATYFVAVGFLAHLQFLGALSTIDQESPADEWGQLGAYLIIAALLQVLGALAANEAARAIEEGTMNRFELRHRFGESLLAQAARGQS